QVVMTFGPGAMVDLLDHAVLVGGLDYWRYDRFKDQGFIDEPRLRDEVANRLESLGVELSVNRAFRLPPAGDDDAPSPFNGLQLGQFPAWFVCHKTKRRALVHSRNLEKEKDRYVHRCSNAKTDYCVRVGFVAPCRNGHLEEFPGGRLVPARVEEPCDVPEIY